MANVTPIVYDAITKEHKPANVGEHISPPFIQVSDAQGNLLQNKTDAGLGVFSQDMVSPLPGNSLTVAGDGKLMVNVPDPLSKEAGNYLRLGNDHGIYLDGNDVLSNGAANLLRINQVDGKVELTEKELKDAGIGAGVSQDEGNLLQEGTDGYAKLTKGTVRNVVTEVTDPMKELIDKNTDNIRELKNEVADVQCEIRNKVVVSCDAKNIIVEGTDKGAYLTADKIVEIVEDAGIAGGVSKDTDNLLVNGTDNGAKLTQGIVDTALNNSQVIKDIKDDIDDVVVVSTDRKNVIYEGRDKGAYLSADDIVEIVEDAGITKVDVKDLIVQNDELMYITGEKIATGIDFNYDALTGKLSATNHSGTEVATATIPSAVSALEHVEVETDPEGQPAGTYIHFLFRLTDGTEQSLYLDVKRLANYYTAGDGISISGDSVISVNKDWVANVADEQIASALEPDGDITEAIVDGINKAIEDGEAIDTAIKDGIDKAIEDGGAIDTAIKDGVDKALDTDEVKEKIGDIVEEAIKDGDVSVVSTDPNNLIKKGVDGGAFLDASEITVGPSTDPGNALTEGTDGKLFYKPVTDYGLLGE